MAHEVESMFYTDWEAPWHGLGVAVHEAPNGEEAMKLAKLDWEVEQVPVFVNVLNKGSRISGTTAATHEVPGFQAVRRKTDGRIFTVRSEKFQPFQNHEAFAFLDALVGTGDLKFDTAGSLFGGKKIWALARTPESIRIGGSDEVIPYILLLNGHDGHTALQVIAVWLRAVCNNTVNAAIAEARQKGGVEVRIYHSSKLAEHVTEARRILGIVNVDFEILRQGAEHLVAVDGLPHISKFLNAMFPPPSGKDKAAVTVYDQKKAALDRLVKESDGTAWGLLNAATAFIDHRPIRSKKEDADSRHMNSALLGADAETKTKATRLILQMTGIYSKLMADREALMVRVRQ